MVFLKIMKSIGGSLFIKNGIMYDYCFIPAIKSLLALCDEVVVMDCQSKDNTVNCIYDNFQYNMHTFGGNDLLLIKDVPWEVGVKYERLAIHANHAKSYLNTDYHLMLQADEVIHEKSFSAIRRAINSGEGNTYMCRRYNLYRDFSSHIKDGSTRKPCSNQIIRLGRTEVPAIGDAESLQAVNCNTDYQEDIKIVHYGFLREDKPFIDKVISMQNWFHGNTYVDKRVIAMKEKDYKFVSQEITPDSELEPLPISHPKFAKEWIKKVKLSRGEI